MCKRALPAVNSTDEIPSLASIVHRERTSVHCNEPSGTTHPPPCPPAAAHTALDRSVPQPRLRLEKHPGVSFEKKREVSSQRAHAGARATAERVRDLEALEAVAPERTRRARPKSYHVYMKEDRAEEVRFVAAA